MGCLGNWRSQRLGKSVDSHDEYKRPKCTVGAIIDRYYDDVLCYRQRAAVVELEAACAELKVALEFSIPVDNKFIRHCLLRTAKT